MRPPPKKESLGE